MNSLNDFASGDTDYISKLNANNALLESAIAALEALVGGATNLQAATVPKGLQYIFDRPGIIGKGSYQPSGGVLTGPNYNLTIAAGGFWDGGALAYRDAAATLSLSGKATGTYYLNVDSGGSPSLSLTAGARSIWQFAYDSGTHEVDNVAVYSGAAVLFDGVDYADALSSTALGLTFASLAERLEEIESRLVDMGTYYQYDPATTDGLTFGFKSGKVRNDNVVWETAADSVTLVDDATNYVEIDPADGAVGANTTGFTAALIPLYEVVTASGGITSIADKRTWVAAGGGGEGGGHAQNTDTGTTSPIFKLNMAETGAPSENCELKVERGTSPDVGLRWNETEHKWQFTNDGENYKDVVDLDDLQENHEATKYIGLHDPPKVLEDLARQSSAVYETLDLSSYISALNGVQAVVLRVFFWDDAPAGDVNVKFRQKDGASPAQAYTVWSNQYEPALLIVPVLTDLAVEFYVAASGDGAANLQVFLVGYMEKVAAVGPKGADGAGVPAGGDTGQVLSKNSGEDFDTAWVAPAGSSGAPWLIETGRLYTAKMEYQSIGAGATQTLLNYTGKGVVRNLFIAMVATDWNSRERSLLNIYIDGEASPSVSASLANFHCADYMPNNNVFSSRLVGYNFNGSNNIAYYRYINIPFATSIKIDLVNGSGTTAITNAWMVVGYHAGADLAWGRYKKLYTYEQRVSVAAYAARNLLNVSGRGVFHGLYMLMDGGDGNLNYLEGNIKMYIDGESTPSIEWSGTEDYFLWGFFFQGGVFAQDYVGCTRKATDIIGAYRFHIEDPIPFDESLLITWNNGDASQGVVTNNTYLSSLAWYYLDS